MKTALTGGIACGKSTLAKFLTELGICLLDADDVVHELEAPGGAAVGAILARFPGAATADGSAVDRKKLAAVVFGDDAARHDLEAILFPLVKARLEAHAARKDVEFPISVIPLLFESHWNENYDTILVISSSREMQINRMMSTRGYSRAHAEARLAAQMPIADKIRNADYVVRNDSTPENLRNEACRLVAWLKERKNTYEH